MTSMLKQEGLVHPAAPRPQAHRDRQAPGRRAGLALTGDGADVAIEKTYRFANYYETISFVNALAFIANAQDHHPDLSVHYNRCVVRFNTHDVNGISETDFECARRSTRCWADQTSAWLTASADTRAGRGSFRPALPGGNARASA
jgi:pterin-4a-carbinolamine dehydratase